MILAYSEEVVLPKLKIGALNCDYPINFKF